MNGSGGFSQQVLPTGIAAVASAETTRCCRGGVIFLSRSENDLGVGQARAYLRRRRAGGSEVDLGRTGRGVNGNGEFEMAGTILGDNVL